MAKDGTNRGGRRVRAGDKPDSLADKIANGSRASIMEFIPPELDGKDLNCAAELLGEDMPSPGEYLSAHQCDGKPLGADTIYAETWNWLKVRGCEKLVNPRLLEAYAQAFARFIQCEEAISTYGLLGKHPTTGGATMQDSVVYLAPHDVLHIPGLGFDGLVGYSPIAMAKNAIGMAVACEEYGAKFFANGASPGGVLEHPGVVKDPERLRDSWNSVYQGSGNSHRIAVLEEGVKYNSIGISPEQAQFLETRKFQINEIARIFRVPPHMVGDLEKSSFSNIEQQSLEFVKYTLDPWVVRWEQSIHRALFSDEEKSEYFVKFNVDGLLRGDYQSRMNGYAIGRQNGWMNANDIRELENLDLISEENGGNLYLINGNMLRMNDAGVWSQKYTNREDNDASTNESG